ncbi:Alkaline phosphatase-like, alpha/beta/alpha [Penicillium expansum]|uniref:Alkaline phosphatase-like, alpha/beta/alpha n=1 Tax=Penicillium expansum TaxID=27334 RepID=A0A0A2JIM2_PENEN|nr:Alkaline phosphatase-like, alpha/beta/alpha [Penicillium expansum]KGO39282.1 Alkaline phosphatase-like, alpha/beta/alpha [Penicillium expansum]KGO55204.1 Alkaline phosphatase-like, alpha/beta/alpha [Penicillium expansum]
MKSPLHHQGDLSLRRQLEDSALFAVKVARSPQLYLDASRTYFFSITFISLILSKCFHLCVHLTSLAVPSLLPWGPTFFLVDILLILVACYLARPFESRIGQNVAAVVTLLFSLYISSMTAANISFYVHKGEEIAWRKSSSSHKDNANTATQTILSMVAVAILVDTLVMIGAYFATPCLFQVTDSFLEIWGSLFLFPFRRCVRRKVPADPETYQQIEIEDYDEGHNDNDSVSQLDTPENAPVQNKSRSLLKRVIAISCGLILVLLSVIRPRGADYSFLSKSLSLAPFGSHKYSPAHERPTSANGSATPESTPKSAPSSVPSSAPPSAPENAPSSAADGNNTSLPADFSWLDGHTALDSFPTFDWLPSYNSSDGFPDWSPFRINKHDKSDYVYEHYNPMKDPLHTPNLQNDILEPLRDLLHSGSVKIKHVILIKLESTRQDVWPFRSNSYIMKHINDSYPAGIPEKVQDRLSNLTPTAERLTGFDTGFHKDGDDHPKPYGGISARNAYTSGTYTLKSITGTVCGVNPMAVEANLEYLHDIYQPCLPHILDTINHQPDTKSQADDWTSWPWHTMWMQSHPDDWDKHYMLHPALGYKDIMAKRTIDATGKKYIPEETTEEEEHGHEDKLLKNYLRDVIDDAKKNNTRLFLSHLTHNTHTPYYKPGDYNEMMGDVSTEQNERLNRYLNTIAYQDEWIADILKLLDDAGIADETLLVMTGDHGLSLPNDGGITAWHSPHVGNFHVPLFFSHPKLPQLEVNDAVLSTQILPTILDLLVETSSIDKQSTKIIKDLLPMYEGQSMIRALIPEHNGKQEWHFSTMNPGGTWFCMRAAAQPYRLVVPLKPDAKWRFTDVVADPFELNPQEDLQLLFLVDVVRKEHGPEAVKWLSEAAHVAKWWVGENHRRWQYDPKNPENN